MCFLLFILQHTVSLQSACFAALSDIADAASDSQIRCQDVSLARDSSLADVGGGGKLIGREVDMMQASR